jgi:thiamine kinase-like enzyme
MAVLLGAEQLNELFEEFPALAGRPRELQELSGGLTNRNVKITTPNAVFVARCTDTSTNMLDIDRDQECHNTRAAAAAGVGAPVIDYRPDLGIMLLGYLPGKTLSNDDFQRPETLSKAAAAIRALHTGPRFRGRFDMFEKQPAYLKTVLDNGFRIPPDYLDHADIFDEIAGVLTRTDQTTVPCNNDLLAGNFIDDGDRMWLIDYEYSGNNDPCFELGNTWAECELSADQLDDFVAAYYGRRLRHKVARAHLQGIVGKYGWTLWGCIQNESSAIDFDFWEWAMQRYEGAVAEFKGPILARLIDDVQAVD